LTASASVEGFSSFLILETSDNICSVQHTSFLHSFAENLEHGKHGIFFQGGSGSSSSSSGSMRNKTTTRLNKGDAVTLYNFRDEGSAQLDGAALHCGSPQETMQSGLQIIDY